eukprot:4461122-Pyramimonas_sp.AAC.1
MEAPREFFDGARWAPVIATRVTVPDNILGSEGDACILGIKHILRSRAAFGKHILLFVDNVPLALGCCKGRAASIHLRRAL